MVPLHNKQATSSGDSRMFGKSEEMLNVDPGPMVVNRGGDGEAGGQETNGAVAYKTKTNINESEFHGDELFSESTSEIIAEPGTDVVDLATISTRHESGSFYGADRNGILDIDDIGAGSGDGSINGGNNMKQMDKDATSYNPLSGGQSARSESKEDDKCGGEKDDGSVEVASATGSLERAAMGSRRRSRSSGESGDSGGESPENTNRQTESSGALSCTVLAEAGKVEGDGNSAVDNRISGERATGAIEGGHETAGVEIQIAQTSTAIVGGTQRRGKVTAPGGTAGDVDSVNRSRSRRQVRG